MVSRQETKIQERVGNSYTRTRRDRKALARYMHPSRDRYLIGGFSNVESSLAIILCIASLVILI